MGLGVGIGGRLGSGWYDGVGLAKGRLVPNFGDGVGGYCNGCVGREVLGWETRRMENVGLGIADCG